MNISTCIVIPCFNHGQYLDECLQSVFAQTRSDWEAVVVDDCSTDPFTISKIKAIKHPKVKVIRHTSNKGLAAARNTGIRASSTPFVLPFDSDDKLHPEYLEHTVNVLESTPGIDCVFTDFQCFGTQNTTWHKPVKGVSDMLADQWIPGPGTLMRRTLWIRLGGYCEDPALRPGNEDWEFWISAMEKGCNPAVVSKPLYFYQTHQESMVTRLQYVDYKTRLFIYNRHRALFEKYGKKNEFLAGGYTQASMAAVAKKEYLLAFYLALFAFRYMPSILIKVLLNSMCPNFLRGIVRLLRKRNTIK